MRKREIYTLDLDDLGTFIDIKKIEFWQSNNFGLCGVIFLRINDSRLCDELDILRDIIVTTEMTSFDNGSVTGILFKTCKSYDCLGKKDEMIDEFIFEEAEEPFRSVNGLMPSKALQNVFSAYATARFFKQFKTDWDFDFFKKKDRDSLSPDEDENYTIQYLVSKNYELLTAEKQEEVSWKSLVYPERSYPVII